MNLLMAIKKRIYKKEYQEYIQVQQQLRNTQLKSTSIFIKVKEDPNRHTGTDPELNEINDKANKLVWRYVELDRFFYGKKSKFGRAPVEE